MPRHPPLAREERFWNKVDKRSPSECWPWTAGNNGMYGCFDGSSSHRVSFLLAGGTLEPGDWVLHNCDFPLCVNPNHLRKGTPKDNAQDCTARGRRNHPHSEKAGRAKITEADVLEIRWSDAPRKVFADRFGITPGAVSHIRTGRSWKYVKNRFDKDGNDTI
jgi:hypothetical protein